MEIVSIKKFFEPETPKPENYIRFIQFLLNAISVHAVEANEIELTRFRQEVSNISETLSVRSTAKEIEVALGFVMRAVAGYNRIAARMTRAHVNELQAMLNMMSNTIAFLSDSSKTGVEQLQAIERNLQRASTVGDVRVLRSKLNDCLVLVRKESLRLRDESHSHIAALQAKVIETANHVRTAGITLPEVPPAAPRGRTRVLSPDFALMGLPGREAAEELISSNISRGREFFVTLFVIDRFAFIDGRFGSGVCGEMLLLLKEYLGEQLKSGSLFKWSAPAFAVIDEACQPQVVTESQMMRIASKRFEKTIQEDRRTALFPITCSCMVRKVSDIDSLEHIAEILDDFVVTKADQL